MSTYPGPARLIRSERSAANGARGPSRAAIAIALTCLVPTACNVESQIRATDRNELTQEALRLLSEGRLEDALAPIDEALGHPLSDTPDPTRSGHVRLLLFKAQVLSQLGRTDEAELTIDRARSVDPTRTELVLQDAMTRLEAGDTDGAFEIIDEALGRSTANPELLLERAILRLDASDPAGAAADFDQVIALIESMSGPEPPQELGGAYLGYAVASAATDPTEGVDSFFRGLDIVGSNALAVLGPIAASGYDQTIVDLVRSASEQDPDHSGLAPIQASLLLAAGDVQGAIAQVERRLPDETDADSRINLLMIAAQAEGMRGQPGAAIPWIERALDEDPSNVTLLEFLAVQIERAGLRPTDVDLLRRRMEAATLAVEDPQQLRRLEALAVQVDALDRNR